MIMINLLYHNGLDQSASQMELMKSSSVMPTQRNAGVLTRMAMKLPELERLGQ